MSKERGSGDKTPGKGVGVGGRPEKVGGAGKKGAGGRGKKGSHGVEEGEAPEDESSAEDETEVLKFPRPMWDPKDRGGVRHLLLTVKRMAKDLGLFFVHHEVPARDLKEVPEKFLVRKAGLKGPEAQGRQAVVGENRRWRHSFWPFCTAPPASEPLHPLGPYPRGWERALAERLTPRMVLEYDYHKPGASKGRGEQRARELWGFLLDYYPWVLPKEISRPPYWEERHAVGLQNVPLDPP